MSRGGIGSASIVLVFAVVCLTIFTVMAYGSALMDERLIESEVRLIEAFYAADSLAEQVLAEVLTSEIVPDYIMGVEIFSYWDWDILAEIVSFVSPITDTREIYVSVAIYEDSYRILTWRVYETGEWEVYDRLNVWPGFFEDDDDFFGGF